MAHKNSTSTELNKPIVSFACGKTYDLINETHIHAHPVSNHYPSKVYPFLMARAKGGFTDILYRVVDHIELNPKDKSKVNALTAKYDSVKRYINRRLSTFGFNKAPTPYRFYLLEPIHRFKPAFVVESNNEHPRYYYFEDVGVPNPNKKPKSDNDKKQKVDNHNDDLESLCQRADSSISIIDALKKKADEFSKYIHDKDKSDNKIDFSNSKSILAEELYKEELFKRSQRALSINSWDKTWIGSGKLFAKLLPVVLDKDNNLINNFNNKTNFNDHFRKGNDKYDPRSERVVFDIFKGENERQAFEDAKAVFGKKYPTIGYLFFLKDDTRFLPISPENFERSFRELNIKIKLQNNCTWENYNQFIQIIDCIRKLMPSLMDLEHKPTLLEAHSFVWIIGRPEFTNWIKGQEYQKKKAFEKERKKQEAEERELNIARQRSLTLADFSVSELLKLGPKLKNLEIHNTLKGAATIIDFSNKPSLSMDIVYKDKELDGDTEPINILLSDTARKNFYFSQETVDFLLSDENSEALDTVGVIASNDTLVIPDNEEDQCKQATILSIEQLKTVAKDHEDNNPERRDVTTKQYRRDPYIAELAKRQANGICQLCRMKAPFMTAEGKPYLETHHIRWLSEGGSDTIENTVAVCPNCHRRLHILNDAADVDYLISLKRGEKNKESYSSSS